MNALDGSENDTLWIEDENVHAEGDSELVPESCSENNST
jgi:hypothetical protein